MDTVIGELYDKAPGWGMGLTPYPISGAFFIGGIARLISFAHGYVEKKEMLAARKVYTMEEE